MTPLHHPLKSDHLVVDNLPNQAAPQLGATRFGSQSFLHMLLSFETSDDGEQRAYFTRVNSVVSYFTDDGEGGVTAHAGPGEFACPWSTTPEKIEAVRMAMLNETARRLQCRLDQVALHSLEDIKKICDPHLKHHHSWAGRSKAPSRRGR